jgi:hypothetical protein
MMTAMGAGATGSGKVAVVQGGLAMAGYAARKLSERITRQKAEQVSEIIRSRSPLAKRVGNPMLDWGRAVKEFETSPTARNTARLAIASRNLSNNLKDAGVDVSPEELALPRAAFDERFAGVDAQP